MPTSRGTPGSQRRGPTRTLLASILLLLAGFQAGDAQQRRGVPVWVPGGAAADDDGTQPIQASEFKVRLESHPATVLAARRVDDWEIVIVADLPLSTEQGLRTAVESLATRAEQLTALGPVRVMITETGMSEILAATRDPDSLRDALRSLPGLGASGAVLARRSTFRSDAEPLDRFEAGRDELQLVRWQREVLVDWLLNRKMGGPTALFLLQDGFDFEIERFYGLPSGALAGSPSAAMDDRLLGPALAASGWVVFPMQPSRGHPDSGDALLERTLLGTPLAEDTGGVAVSDLEDLDRALDLLARAVRLEIAVEFTPTGPLALQVQAGAADYRAPRWLAGAFLPGRSAARARRFLGEEDRGEIPVSAAILHDGPDERSVVVEVRADLDIGSADTSSWLSLTLYLDQLDGLPRVVELPGSQRSLAGIDRWIVQSALVLPEEPGELVAVVTNARTGDWGAARVEEDILHLSRRGPGLLIEQFDLRPPEPAEIAGTPDTAIRLLPPSGSDLAGRQRFQTLILSPAVAKVVFYLDGEQTAEDDRAPFVARIDLGRRVARHTVRADALNALGEVVGSDSIRLNEPARSFSVSIASLARASVGSPLEIEVEVAHPTDVEVVAVELYYNEDRVARLTSPPWQTRIEHGEVGMTDYVRAVAYLDDGRFLEDVRLLSAPGASEIVRVNLVQLYVVATDRDGEPVGDLTAEDFIVRFRGQPQRIERFAYADEVPLRLGLVVDTSPSMWALMPDTKKAAAKFLVEIVSERDEALVVDFDTRPRLAAPLTADVTDLLLSLGSLVAEPRGTTALYDSVIFAALQLPAGQDRKALVLLTDGDDYKSRFGARQAIQTAKQAGVPVYVVSLAGLHDARRQFRRTELDALTHQTGGEAFYLGSMDELGATYDRIARELRSQYLIAFPTDRQLTDDDLARIRVEVTRPGLKLRTVVGGRSVH